MCVWCCANIIVNSSQNSLYFVNRQVSIQQWKTASAVLILGICLRVRFLFFSPHTVSKEATSLHSLLSSQILHWFPRLIITLFLPHYALQITANMAWLGRKMESIPSMEVIHILAKVKQQKNIYILRQNASNNIHCRLLNSSLFLHQLFVYCPFLSSSVSCLPVMSFFGLLCSPFTIATRPRVKARYHASRLGIWYLP